MSIDNDAIQTENIDLQLVSFLRNLATEIESGEIGSSQLQIVGEFFMRYQFQQQAIMDNDNSVKQDKSFNKEDMVKFITMGWFIYCILLDGGTVPEIQTDE